MISDTPPQPTEDDKEHILQVLYLLDKFAVSDELYHELRMLCPHLPASNRVKQARKEINELLEYTRLSPPYPGAYRSFKATLVEKISKAVSNFTSFSLGFIGGEGCLLGREGSEWTRGQGVGMLQMCKYRIRR